MEFQKGIKGYEHKTSDDRFKRQATYGYGDNIVFK
jgi:hypothetical protein